MEPGNIVEYIESQKIICSVILEIKKQRLRLLTEGNREVNLAATRLTYKSDDRLNLTIGRDKLVGSLKQIAATRKCLMKEIDIKALWEVLHTEGSAQGSVSAGALSSLISNTLASVGVRVAAGQTAQVPADANIVCERRPSGVTLTHRWFSWMAIVLVPLCLAWDAVVAAAYVFATVQGAPYWVHLLLLPFLLVIFIQSGCLGNLFCRCYFSDSCAINGRFSYQTDLL